MDKTALVTPNLTAGRELVDTLKCGGLPIAVAAWLNVDGALGWRLYIASPDVQTYGSKTVVKFVEKALSFSKSPIPRDSITAVNTTNHFVNKIPSYVEYYDGKVKKLQRHFQKIEFDEAGILEGFIVTVNLTVKPSKEAPHFDASGMKPQKILAA